MHILLIQFEAIIYITSAIIYKKIDISNQPSTKMCEKTLKFDNIRVNKEEFHKSKQPINLELVKVDQIVISEKFKHSDDGFKYFIGSKKMKLFNRYVLSYFK